MLYASGSWIFVPDEDDCFAPARVITSFEAGKPGLVDREGHEVKISASDSKRVQRMDEQSANPIANMVELKELNEAAILHNLRMRFNTNEIYTNVGSILVSVNPFKLLPIYTPAVLEKYKLTGYRGNPPHVYGVADDAYRSMVSNQRNQSCIVSGESGAGKTEATKIFLQYLAEISGTDNSKKSSAKKDAPTTFEEASLQEQILKANPLMEAFGNAKTVRNNNSSRFGKYIEVKFNNQKGTVVGGQIVQYLLEKSRLVHQAEGERNYHIFYDLCAGANMDPAVKEKFRISDPDQYAYLNQSGVTTVEGINDERDWEDVMGAMEVIGISLEQQDEVLRTLAAILHLGNIEFDDGGGKFEEGSKVKNHDMLELCASQLGNTPAALEKALTTKEIGTSKDKVLKVHNVEQAGDARDVLAKEIYSKVFDWLIDRINKALSIKSKMLKTSNKGSESSIGVLDIFGFETFAYNSFEQLCINYCNEKLQFHFNEHIFKLEQEEYRREGVDVSKIEFIDNRPTLDLLEAKSTGVFAMLDEEMNIPRGADEKYLSKMCKRHGPHPNFIKSGMKTTHERNSFSIVHYAGAVMYNVFGFMEKNKDRLSNDLERFVTASKSKFVSALFTSHAKQETGRVSKGMKQSIGSKFKNQLNNLMKTLNATEPHFIRCVKPNEMKSGDLFSSNMVLDQLRYAGLLEVCRIRQIGYPVRKSFTEFFRRYLPLAAAAKDPHDLAKLLNKAGLFPKGEYQMGKSKVFMRTGAYGGLELRRDAALRAQVVTLQRVARGFVARTRVRKYRTTMRRLKKGIKKRDYDYLADAIEAAADLPNQNLAIISEARSVLAVLEKEKRTTELVQKAIDNKELAPLQSALQAARDAGIENSTTKKGVKLEKRLLSLKATLKELGAAVAARDLSNLKKVMKKAKELELTKSNEYIQAEALQNRLVEEGKILDAVEEAMATGDLEKITAAVQRAQEQGLDKDSGVIAAQKKVEELLELRSAEEKEAAHKEAAKIRKDREKKVNKTKKLLMEAAKAKDLVKLAEARAKVIELGMSGKEVDLLIKEAESLEAMSEHVAEINAAIDTATNKVESHQDIESSDVGPLSAAIKAARERGLGDNVSEMQIASSLEVRMKEQLKVQKKLQSAIDSGELKKLKKVLDSAGDLDMETPAVLRVRQLVKEKEAARPKEERMKDATRKEVDMDEDEFERQRKANMAMAKHERYNFRKYYKIRTDSDYVKGVYFNKKRVAEQKLMYQNTVIPKSLLELDKELNKMAIGVHKSMLGYCGEQLMSFPATLAQDILIKGLEQPELVDEIYIQLCKHLTTNPKPESVGRAWQVMCMAVGTFPPSSDFEYYLLNFLIDHLKVKGLVGNYARYSLRRLEGMLIRGASGFVPNIDEILAYKERPPILATIELVDGTPLTEDLPITPDLNVDKVLEICTHFLSLQDDRTNTFGVFVQDTNDDTSDLPVPQSAYSAQRMATPDGEPPPPPSFDNIVMPTIAPAPTPPPRTPRPLRGKDYMGDVVVQMTRQRRVITFVFKRKIFLPKQDFKSSDPVYSRLMYLQAADEVISGNIPVSKESEVVDLTALAVAADSESFPSSEGALLEADLMEYIPVPWRNKKTEKQWAKAVLELKSKYGTKSLDSLQAKYVDMAHKYPLWGMCFFFVRKEAQGADMVCAINYEGVHFFSLARNLLQTFKYTDVHRWGGSSTQFWLLVWDEKKQQKIKMALYTSQARDMSALILDYALLAAERK